MDVRKEPQPPCKDCSRRHLKCHSECAEYIKFRADRDLWLEEKREAFRRIHDAIDHDQERYYRRMKWQKYHKW
jgi:hypothetical protein